MSVVDEIKKQQDEWNNLANCIERIFGEDEGPVIETLRLCAAHLVFLIHYVEDTDEQAENRQSDSLTDKLNKLVDVMDPGLGYPLMWYSYEKKKWVLVYQHVRWAENNGEWEADTLGEAADKAIKERTDEN
jgi:hypothetical protein